MRVIKLKMIRPELRFMGDLVRFLSPSYSIIKFKIANVFMGIVFKGKKFAFKIKSKQIYIDNSIKEPMRTLVFTPRVKKNEKRLPAPGVLWIHGGGYAIGEPEQDTWTICDIIETTGGTVIAPCYRNSIQSPYPAALDDCYAALLWLKEHADELYIKTDQIFVAGSSAGGGLTAAISLYARDKGEVSIAYQMPLYPMLDDRETPSSANNDAPVWNTRSNKIAWKLYLDKLYGTDDIPAYAVPARATDYLGLPPTLTYIGTVEPFLDETEEYVKNLRDAGVEVKYRTFEGCYHAFDMQRWTKISHVARKFYMDGFIYAKEHYFKEQPKGKE